jgi:hypothetical protein
MHQSAKRLFGGALTPDHRVGAIAKANEAIVVPHWPAPSTAI